MPMEGYTISESLLQLHAQTLVKAIFGRLEPKDQRLLRVIEKIAKGAAGVEEGR